MSRKRERKNQKRKAHAEGRDSRQPDHPLTAAVRRKILRGQRKRESKEAELA